MKTLLLGAATVLLVYIGAAPLARAADDGYTPILDQGHTDGWKHIGEGDMEVQDGVASTAPAKGHERGTYYYQKKTFTNFSLKLEFKSDAPASESAIYVRFPEPSGDVIASSRNNFGGYAIKLWAKNTGAIYFLPQHVDPAFSLPVRPGEWNEMEVTAIGQNYVVKFKGQEVTEYTGNRALSGYIGLQTMPINAQMHFRNVRIKELPSALAADAPASKAPPPSKQIEPFLEPSLNAILAPLGENPQMPRIPVEKLRASLGAGVVTAKTPAQQQIYQCAIAVCDALTNGMDERAQARAAAIQSGLLPSVSNGASIVKTAPLRGWDAGAAAEAIRKKQKDERSYADKQAKGVSNFADSAAFKAWVAKATLLRDNAMGLYSKLVQYEAVDSAPEAAR